MSKNNNLNYRRIERTVKGFSNHRRIQIMDLLFKKPELSVAEISDLLKINFKTSQHITRLAFAGLIMKRSDGTSIRHKLTPLGESVLKFCRTLE